MGILDKAVDIQDVAKTQLWVIWGKSGTGKTHIIGTFPKPLLLIMLGDDGIGTLDGVEGIDVIRPENVAETRKILEELRLDKKYKTVACDTFSLIVQEWTDENSTKKKKRMSQQMWGDLKTETEEFVKMFKILALNKTVVLTCHQSTDVVEGMEDEILPDVRPSVSKGARTYLESMANIGIHTTVLTKEKELSDGSTKTITAHAVHIAANPYYWTKVQKPAHIKLPSVVINPSYDKITKIISGGKNNG